MLCARVCMDNGARVDGWVGKMTQRSPIFRLAARAPAGERAKDSFFAAGGSFASSALGGKCCYHVCLLFVKEFCQLIVSRLT